MEVSRELQTTSRMQNSVIAMELLRFGMALGWPRKRASALTFIIGKLVRKSLIFVKARDGPAPYSELGSCTVIVAMPAESKA